MQYSNKPVIVARFHFAKARGNSVTEPAGRRRPLRQKLLSAVIVSYCFYFVSGVW